MVICKHTFFGPELPKARHTNNVQIFVISEAVQYVFLAIIPLVIKNKRQQITLHEKPKTLGIICLENEQVHNISLSCFQCNASFLCYSVPYTNPIKNILKAVWLLKTKLANNKIEACKSHPLL